ncbi:MAG TPA: alanine dehydrogenase [Bacteroidia bacterium]|nr:alanine dehydrogenase [Bacteroidia bacterium]
MVMTKDVLFSLTKGAYAPQEEMLEVARKKGKLLIGIPKEIAFQENRVALVPDAVALLTNNGHRIIIESGAGKAANFEDTDYSEAGAEIVQSVADVYKAEVIFKIAPPTLAEIELMQPKQTLFTALQLTVQPQDFLKKLTSKKLNCVAFDLIIDDAGIFPVIRAMGEIAGGASILIAAELLSNVNNGVGTILGGISGISPTEVVIIGAGTVGETAARAALGLGATVKVFDNSTSRLRRLQNQLPSRVFTSVIVPKVLEKHLKTADVAIGALRATKGRTPCVVTEGMVSEMKTGSVIIDVSIDQGGVFETSRVTNHTQPVFRKNGVIHYCVPNINSRVARTASYALSNIFSQIILNMGDEGGFDSIVRKDPGLRNGVYIYNGILTNQFLGEAFNLPFKDINLLMAAM